ncbi:hypothetical protein [Tistlia consotensis]|uniref:hypothetical protein n=1 Tax=Tistlia consotensis TaxID=1321365 RepID=UPI00117DB6D4|nr:hypothetical protein [Tistlia consotensis]
MKLLLAAEALSGYAAPAAPPAVEFVAHRELEQRACNGACAVFGWFPPGHTIYLDASLNPLEDLHARAVLLHELVHYLQQENHAFEGPATCRTWLDKERQAFEVERRWTMAQPNGLRSVDWSRRVPLQAFCRDEPSPPVAQARHASE